MAVRRRALWCRRTAREAARKAAAAFAAEFARVGYSPERIFGFSRDPFYVGAHRALGVLGEAEMRHIVAEAVQRRARRG